MLAALESGDSHCPNARAQRAQRRRGAESAEEVLSRHASAGCGCQGPRFAGSGGWQRRPRNSPDSCLCGAVSEAALPPA